LTSEVTHNDLQIELSIRKKAAEDFLVFIKYTKPDFEINWHHSLLAHKLQDFSDGKIKKLMIYLPPQVGKSEMSTRRLPAYILGKNPDSRIAVCAYSQTFSSQFNRDIQRIITDNSYKNIFPGTTLNSKNVVSNSAGNYVRNSEVFEVVGHKGRLKTVGVGGALTGTSVDVGIIDDPIKDALEAYSTTFRDRLWDWYNSVFKTRLHNSSQQLITLTRWHEDDLAGRIMKTENDWEIISIPAIKEDNYNPYDIHREIGDTIWESRHSLTRMLEIKSLNPLIFSSLYQQRPYFNAEEGRFAFAFNRQQHVGKCVYNPAHYVYLSFDFNRNPICCSVFQHYDDCIKVLRCIKLKNSNIYALCDEILLYYPNGIFIITGDATGRNSTALVEGNINYYIVIKQKLKLNDGQIRVPTINPKMQANQVLVNNLLMNYKWIIDEANAQALIYDLEYVKMLPDGTIDKSSRTDPTKQADALDTMRYYCEEFFNWFLKNPTTLLQPKKTDATKAAKEIAADSLIVTQLSNMQEVICNKKEYLDNIRNTMLAQVQVWIQEKETYKAEFTLTEIYRLDKKFK
jgi:hypothetical protein